MKQKETLTRYLDYPKFLDLITQKTIFCANPQVFEDKLECLIPEFTLMRQELDETIKQKNLRYIQKNFSTVLHNLTNIPVNSEPHNVFNNIAIQFINAVMLTNKQIFPHDLDAVRELSQSITNELFSQNTDKFENIQKLIVNFNMNHDVFKTDLSQFYRDNIAISCWYADSTESEAMWKLYSKKDGIAIVTDKEKLLKYIDSSEVENMGYKVKLKNVVYRNMQEEFKIANNTTMNKLNKRGDAEYYIFSKQECYKHEHECRLAVFIQRYQPKFPHNLKNGINLGLNGDIEDFIDKIIISPFAPQYYAETLIATLKLMGYEKLSSKITKSEINKC